MPKAVNILGFYVTDVVATVAFYTHFGFAVTRQDAHVAEMTLGEMTFQFIDKETARTLDESFQKEAFGEPKGTGVYINLEVEDIDAFYASLVSSGLTPSTQPRDWPWGHREFVIRDPDSYKIVVYQVLR